MANSEREAITAQNGGGLRIHGGGDFLPVAAVVVVELEVFLFAAELDAGIIDADGDRAGVDGGCLDDIILRGIAEPQALGRRVPVGMARVVSPP